MITLHKNHILIACKYLQRIARKPKVQSFGIAEGEEIRGCVRFEPTLADTRLIATDLTRTAHISIPTGSKIAALHAKKAGPFMVDCAVLANAAATADPETYLSISKDTIQLIIGGQPSTIPVTCPQPDELADPVPQGEWTPLAGTFDTDTLKRLARCVSKDEARYVLQGFFWDHEGKLVATDGRRMHFEPFCPHPQFDYDIIVPTDTIPVIPPRASISTKAGHIAFVATEEILTIRIFSKLVDGKYPNWRAVVPPETSNSVRFDNQAAAKSLRNLARLVTSKAPDNSTIIECATGKVTFRVQSDGASVGLFTQSAIITGSPISTCFNTKFLIDALENGGDTISFQDHESPARITGVKDNLHILMPMRTHATEPVTA